MLVWRELREETDGELVHTHDVCDCGVGRETLEKGKR